MIAATNTNEKTLESIEYAKRIAELNDRFRQTYWGGKVMTTCGVNELSEDIKARLFRAVAEFDSFDWRNDPHGEHDFGKVVVEGRDYFFKIDLHEERPVKLFDDGTYAEAVYTRVLTIMLAEEY